MTANNIVIVDYVFFRFCLMFILSGMSLDKLVDFKRTLK